LNKKNKIKYLIFLSLNFYLACLGTIKIHNKASNIILKSNKSILGIKQPVSGWLEKTITRTDNKIHNIKINDGFTGNTITQNSAPTEISFNNYKTLIDDKLRYSTNFGESINSMSWHPNGNFLAIGGQNPTSGQDEIEIFSFNGTSLTLSYSQSFDTIINSIDWSPSGDFLAIGSEDNDGTTTYANQNEIKIYSFNGSALSLTYSQNYGSKVYSVDWRPDGNYIAVGGEAPDTGNNDVQIYAFNGTSLSFTYSQNYGNRVYSVSWSPNGNYIAFGGENPDVNHDELEVYFFDGSTLSLTYSENYSSNLHATAWSPDGNYLAVGGRKNHVSLHNQLEIFYFNNNNLSLVANRNYQSNYYINSIEWRYNGTQIAVSGVYLGPSSNLNLHSYNTDYANSLIEKKIWSFGEKINSVKWHPEDDYIAFGGKNPDKSHEEINIYSYEDKVGLIYDVLNNSNAIIQNDTQIRWNSSAILEKQGTLLEQKLTNTYLALNQNFKNNSNAILQNNDGIKWNSNAILNFNNNLEEKLTNTYIELNQKTKNNSDAILQNQNEIKWNSNAILNSDSYFLEQKITNTYIELNEKIQNNSNTIIKNNNEIKWSSNAIISSNSFNYEEKLTNTYLNLNQKIKNNSNTILNNKEKTIWNSNAIINLDINLLEQKLTNTYIELNQKIKNNSDTILQNQKEINWNSNAILNLDANAIEEKITNTYFALNQKIKNNSNTILNNKEKIIWNSNALLNLDSSTVETKLTNTYINLYKQIKNNSNTILQNKDEIKWNSNAIISLDSTILEQKLTDTYLELNQKIKNNNNTILQNKEEIKWNSNAIITSGIDALERKLTNTYIELNQKIKNNSDAILQNQKEIKWNSNAILNSNTTIIEQKITNTHDYFLNIIKNNSYAIKNTGEKIKHNSNAIIDIKNKAGYDNSTLNSAEEKLNQNYENTENITSENDKATISIKRYAEENRDSLITLENNITSTKNIIENQIKWNSNTIINNNEKIKHNSNAIINLDNKITNTFANLNNKIQQNSNTIIKINNSIIQNSNSIITLFNNLDDDYLELNNYIKNNSNTIITLNQKLTHNSNTILTNTKKIKFNSNVIVTLDSSPSFTLLQAQINNLDQDITNNSNAIVTLSEEFRFPNIDGLEFKSALTDSIITTDVDLEKSVFIHPNEKIEIDGNVTINGNGAVLIFSNSEHSQFILNAGSSVILKNIQLLRINQNTFNLKYHLTADPSVTSRWTLDDSHIKIGQNVLFGLSENITLSQGLIEIINNDQNEAQVFEIKGIEGQKQFKISPNNDYSKALSLADNGLTYQERLDGILSEIPSQLPSRFTQDNKKPVLIKCNDNTFGLQAINFFGLENITQTESINYIGALGLLGQADVNIGYKEFTEYESEANIKEIYNTVFVIQNIKNNLRLLKDDIKFTGALNFADFGESELHIDFALTQPIVPKLGDDQTRTIPQVNFNTDFVQLTSSNGFARLIFDDNRIRINNLTNALLAYENSYLEGNSIEVTGDPIWDLYDPSTQAKEFILNVYELIGLDDIDNKPIISNNFLTRNIQNLNNKKLTAIDLIYKKELKKL
jgi:WD40 repeat protein